VLPYEHIRHESSISPHLAGKTLQTYFSSRSSQFITRNLQPNIHLTNTLASQVIVEGQITTISNPASMSLQNGKAPQ